MSLKGYGSPNAKKTKPIKSSSSGSLKNVEISIEKVMNGFIVSRTDRDTYKTKKKVAADKVQAQEIASSWLTK